VSVPYRYYRIRFTAVICLAIRFIANRLTIDTIKAILGRDSSIVYIRELISF